MDFDATQTSRSRLIWAGKALFAKSGYEQTATSAIARKAGTSESQLVRYFGGKAGLLEAIFNESWRPLNEAIEEVLTRAPNARDALLGVLSALIQSFGEDPEAAFLLLFESRRVRSSGRDIQLSEGFLKFNDLLRNLISRGKRDGEFTMKFNEGAIVSALMGAAEGMLRDRFVSERRGEDHSVSDKEIRAILTQFIGCL
ncbi:MAG: TetR/AcrR family transcriptional regulator [Acidobacteriota bacterium]